MAMGNTYLAVTFTNACSYVSKAFFLIERQGFLRRDQYAISRSFRLTSDQSIQHHKRNKVTKQSSRLKLAVRSRFASHFFHRRFFLAESSSPIIPFPITIFLNRTATN